MRWKTFFKGAAAGLALAVLAVANSGHRRLVVDTVADGAAKALAGD